MNNLDSRDNRKLRAAIVVSTLLILAVLFFNIFQEQITTNLGGYIKRRIYFERVIKKSGLSLHKAKYWRRLKQ
jgi:hypothetical protein